MAFPSYAAYDDEGIEGPTPTQETFNLASNRQLDALAAGFSHEGNPITSTDFPGIADSRIIADNLGFKTTESSHADVLHTKPGHRVDAGEERATSGSDVPHNQMRGGNQAPTRGHDTNSNLKQSCKEVRLKIAFMRVNVLSQTIRVCRSLIQGEEIQHLPASPHARLYLGNAIISIRELANQAHELAKGLEDEPLIGMALYYQAIALRAQDDKESLIECQNYFKAAEKRIGGHYPEGNPDNINEQIAKAHLTLHASGRRWSMDRTDSIEYYRSLYRTRSVVHSYRAHMERRASMRQLARQNSLASNSEPSSASTIGMD